MRCSPLYPSRCCATASCGYVGMFSVYHLVYGTAATMVVLLAWVYFSGVVLLFGAVVASRMNKLRRMRELNGSTHIASSHLDVDMLILTKTKDGSKQMRAGSCWQ